MSNPSAEAIERCLTSPNVLDSNHEPANLVDVADDMARALFAISVSIDTHAAELSKLSQRIDDLRVDKVTH